MYFFYHFSCAANRASALKNRSTHQYRRPNYLCCLRPTATWCSWYFTWIDCHLCKCILIFAARLNVLTGGGWLHLFFFCLQLRAWMIIFFAFHCQWCLETQVPTSSSRNVCGLQMQLNFSSQTATFYFLSCSPVCTLWWNRSISLNKDSYPDLADRVWILENLLQYQIKKALLLFVFF